MSKLVYVKVHGKLYPEKRPNDMPDNGVVRSVAVYEIALSPDEEEKSLETLSALYPIPHALIRDE